MEEVQIMRRFYSTATMALLASATFGCSDRTTQNQHLSATEEVQLSIKAQSGDEEATMKLERLQKAREAMPESDLAVAPDIRAGWQWSEKEITALTKRAEAGDMKAADRLLQYYSVHEDEANITYWEDRLLKGGSRRATQN